MRRILQIFAVVLLVASCSKNDEDLQGFSKQKQEVLNILSGKWVCEKSINGTVYSTEVISFEPFSIPTAIAPPSDEYSQMEFDGTLFRSYNMGTFENSDNCYFFIDIDNKTITAFGKGSNNNWTLNVGISYSYKVIDNNTIKLKDKKSSSLSEDTFVRKQ